MIIIKRNMFIPFRRRELLNAKDILYGPWLTS
nr:MAG TPA: hypothetical protein [Caudoviricetes sp.]